MSAIGDVLGRFVPLARRKPKIDRKQALAVIPMRNPLVEWERKGKEVVLTVPMRDDRLARVVKKIVRNLPDSRQVGLDDVGSDVWELCDGQRDIDGVVRAISSTYKLTRREAEASVTMFLQTLAKKNLIGLMTAGGKNSAKGNR